MDCSLGQGEVTFLKGFIVLEEPGEPYITMAEEAVPNVRA